MLLLLPFQYISCYSLSVKKFTIPSHICSFNTSHVTLYLFSSFFSFRTSCRFNTSHVTLYPRSVSKRRSVHWRFNTSHVTLYLDMPRTSYHKWLVSIHLMLLFILFPNRLKLRCLRFNTSHVTLYPSFYRLFFF